MLQGCAKLCGTSLLDLWLLQRGGYCTKCSRPHWNTCFPTRLKQAYREVVRRAIVIKLVHLQNFPPKIFRQRTPLNGHLHRRNMRIRKALNGTEGGGGRGVVLYMNTGFLPFSGLPVCPSPVANALTKAGVPTTDS